MSQTSENSSLEDNQDTNFMLDVFNNPSNAFEAGPVMNKANECCRIVLKKVPVKLQRHAIENLLKTFGTVVDLNIPNNQETFKHYQPGFVIVFAEFSKFSEAEKAMREINQSTNKGFSIRVEFARAKRNEDEDELLKVSSKAKESKIEDVWDESPAALEMKQVLHPPPMTVTYDIEQNDVFERVSAFSRKQAPVNYTNDKLMEVYKKLAAQSKGYCDKEAERFTFNQETLNMIQAQQCTECENEGLLYCEETSLVYCSIKCSMIANEPDSDFLPLISYDQLIKLNDKVIICGIINEKCVYVRLRNSDFGCLQNDIYKLAKKAPKLNEFPEVGDLVLVKNLGEPCRAKVLDISDDDGYAISVQLIDYGQTARVFFEELMEMTPALRKLKCTTHKLVLKDVFLEAINGDVIGYLLKLQTHKTELTVVELNGIEAVLVAKPSIITVNQTIMNLSVVDEITYDDEGVMLSDYHDNLPLLSETQQKILVVNQTVDSTEKSSIAFIPEENVKDFIELYKAINLFGDKHKLKSYGISQNADQVCLVFVNEQWHRGIFKKSEKDGFPWYLLLDQFSNHKVKISNIVPMPKAFMLPPPLAEIGWIENFQDEKVKQLAAKTITSGQMAMIKGLKDQNGEIILTIA